MLKFQQIYPKIGQSRPSYIRQLLAILKDAADRHKERIRLVRLINGQFPTIDSKAREALIRHEFVHQQYMKATGRDKTPQRASPGPRGITKVDQ